MSKVFSYHSIFLTKQAKPLKSISKGTRRVVYPLKLGNSHCLPLLKHIQVCNIETSLFHQVLFTITSQSVRLKTVTSPQNLRLYSNNLFTTVTNRMFFST